MMAYLLLQHNKNRINKMLRKTHIHRLIFAFFVAMLMGACSSSKQAGPGATEEGIQKAIDSSRWVFTVSQVMPAYGRSRQMTGDYSVICKGQKLEVYLPYFGRATSGVDVYSGRGPLDFSTEKFAIDPQQIKPGEWRIRLKPDIREVEIMDFTFFANGTAHLAVRMNSRSAISYNGTVRPLNRE
jgi:hypothetical protein